MRLDDSSIHPELTKHVQDIKRIHMRDMFENDVTRFDRFSIQGPHIFLDYSKNRINEKTIQLLLQAAKSAQLQEHIKALFGGERVNNTEHRPALHTALREFKSGQSIVQDPTIVNDVLQTRQKMSDFIGKIHQNEYLGYTGKPLRTLVSIGIGGSFLGPKTVTEALTPYTRKGFDCHYVANIDASDLVETLNVIDPESTLFLIQSKTFSTLETLENAKQAKDWLANHGLTDDQISKHLIAVTANTQAAIQFGIHEDHIFPMWDWVGGRYSLWSSIGLPIAFLLGMNNFEALLQGANDMDRHFYTTDFANNLPVIMALLGIWYNNYFGADSHAVIPYDQYLQYLPAHLQQLDMESSGKRVDRRGRELSYDSGPVIWGGPGCNGQHAYHQLLHQGTRMIPVDFIIPTHSHHDVGDHHHHLYSNCLSQSKALMQGKNHAEALGELLSAGMKREAAQELAAHKVIPGNKPSNTLILDKVTPQSVGALIALYEHKVFVQGVLWDINSFDQWGVELGKTLSQQLYQSLLVSDTSDNEFDASTMGLLNKYRQRK